MNHVCSILDDSSIALCCKPARRDFVSQGLLDLEPTKLTRVWFPVKTELVEGSFAGVTSDKETVGMAMASGVAKVLWCQLRPSLLNP